jgi:hypothetical protein
MNAAKESSMRKIGIICILLLTLLLSGCQVYKSMQPINESATSGTLLFSDDFASNTNAWGTSGNNIGEILFEYEGLDIKVNTPNSLLWTVTADQFRDTQIEVDGVLLGGPSDDAFGVICRYQDNEHFYGFLLSHDGYYGIFKMDDGNMLLADSQSGLKYSDAIRQGGVVNHIQAVCQGGTLRLTVNGTVLSEVQDSSYIKGQMGLIVGTYEIAGTEVFFDNLQIFQP